MRSIFPLMRAATAILILFIGISSGPAQTPPLEKLRVGYVPAIIAAPVAVIEKEGWAREAGLEVTLVRAPHPPALVQAAANGQLDIIYAGSTLFAMSIANRIPLKIIAGGSWDTISLAAQGPLLQEIKAEGLVNALTGFSKKHGRKPKLAVTNPAGIPHVMTLYWMRHVAKIDPAAVEWIHANLDQVQGLALSHAVDAFATWEPMTAALEEKRLGFEIVAQPRELFPLGPAPAGVVAARADLIKKNRPLVDRWLALHRRATTLLQTDAQRAALGMQIIFGQGLVQPATLVQAMERSRSTFSADLESLKKPLSVLAQLLVEEKLAPRIADPAALFANEISAK